jgi:prepilin-type N-terminal cleavage/methylation domain-containing protein
MPHPKQSRRYSGASLAGFSLVEMMIAIAIVGILAGIAMPAFRDMIHAQRIRGTATDLYMALLSARSEAMKRNASVSVVAAAGGWCDGWEVQVQSSGMVLQTQTVDRTNAVLVGPSTFVGFPPPTTNPCPAPAAYPPTAITFGANGRPITASAGARVTIYAPQYLNTVRARCISLSLNGMPEVAGDTDSNPANGC